MLRVTLVSSLLFISMLPAVAEDQQLLDLQQLRIPGLITSAIGVTRQGTPIVSLLSETDLDLKTPKTRILLIGGLDGSTQSVASVLDAAKSFYGDDSAARWRERFVLSVVPCGNPDGTLAETGRKNGSGGTAATGYPPQGVAYNDPHNPESIYLWRWIGMHAPDLVVDVRAGSMLRWFVPPTLAAGFDGKIDGIPMDSLTRQVRRVAPCETGPIEALQVETPGQFFPELLAGLQRCSFAGPSPARRELQRRLDRTPLQVAEQLSQHYGHDLSQVVYIPALALMGRVRLGALTGDSSHLTDVKRITAPYYDGNKPSNPKSGSGLSGHLVFCELAQQSQAEERERYLELARAAADLGFDGSGASQPSMPFHLEMSDSVFMGGPILARVGRLTGQARYFEACVKHLQFMRQLVLRDDGIYRHSPLDETAWGRGNGFPALGLAMCLTDFPADHPQRPALLAAYRDHMQALVRHQDPTGAWHQVIDHQESYRELTSTCMITFAMARGISNGWLAQQQFQPVIDKAWRAIRTRVPSNGRLVDVCTGTGKHQSLRDYYDRKAILGPDARGGAMAILVATELARSQ